MNKLTPKQVPQFAALCVLSTGMFGYFVVRMVTPSPAAAGTRPPVAPAAPAPAQAAPPVTRTPGNPAGQTADAAGATAAPTTGAAGGDDASAPPPTPGMRDPFVIGYVDPKTAPTGIAPPVAPTPPPAPKPAAALRLASLPPAPVGGPAAPALPDFRVSPGGPATSGLPPAFPSALAPKAPPLPPAAPAWTVTGVLQGDAGQVAILRDGEARRIVRAGDFADSVYKVVEVTRTAVTLRHGQTFYRLTLGALKAAPVSVSPALFIRPAAPAGPTLAPTPVGRPAASLTRAGASLLRLARTCLASTPAALLPPALEHARRAENAQAALRFLQD